MRFLWTTIVALLIGGAPGYAVEPVLDRDFADPFVLVTATGLVAYATNSDEGGMVLHIPRSSSRDGRHWSPPVEAMPAVPRWARLRRPDLWAPEVIAIGDRYVMYFSARHATRTRADGGTLCIGTAVARRPEGPFAPASKPLTCGGAFGVIDASPFRDGQDLWLYMKTDGNCCGAPTTVLAARLSADGLHLAAAPVPVPGATNDAAWEGKVIEGPEMRRHADRLYLFFAGGDFGGAGYALGYARCETPAGPCVAAGENPILASGHGLVGPGHGCIFDWRGRTWLAVAGWRNAPSRRAMYLLPLDWSGDRPIVTAEP